MRVSVCVCVCLPVSECVWERETERESLWMLFVCFQYKRSEKSAQQGKKPSQDVLESGWKENANQSRSIITLTFSKFFKEKMP